MRDIVQMRHVARGLLPWLVLNEDSEEALGNLDANSIDSLITDPPAGIGFMGKEWDSDKGGRDQWIAWLSRVMAKCLLAMKPGAHGLVWALPRTSHWTAMALEDAGFEIRDIHHHIFGTGFPKDLRISRDPRFCQCDEPARNVADRDLSQLQSPHTDTVADENDDDPRREDARRSNDTSPGSPVGCQQVSDFDDELSLRREVDGQVSFPSPQCAPTRSRSSSHDDALAPEPVGTPSPVPHTNRHANTGSTLPSASATSSPSDTSSNTSSSWHARPDRTSNTSSANSHRWPSKCQVCGKPDAAGFGTALKPAVEHWILIRKPLNGTVAANVLEYGTGALAIDACRIGYDAAGPPPQRFGGAKGEKAGQVYGASGNYLTNVSEHGRWPAHLSLDEFSASCLDEQSGERTSGNLNAGHKQGTGVTSFIGKGGGEISRNYGGDTGGASRFFFVAKGARSEKDHGLDHLPPRTGGEATEREDGSAGLENPRAGAGRNGGARNHHPTVKSIALMRWLVRLITPPGGIVLDCFAGSGTTGIACQQEMMRTILIEKDSEFASIARDRLKAWR